MDTGNRATENFVAQQTAAYFAGLYQSKKSWLAGILFY